MGDELVGAETAKAGQEVAKFGTRLVEAVEKAGTLPKAQAFVSKVIGAPIENLVGLFMGDPLLYVRIRVLSYYQDRVEKILEQRGVKEPQPVSPSIAIPLIEAASNETRDELSVIWAKLLAAAMDPDRSDRVRLDIIAAVKQMEPIDALILQKLYGGFQQRIHHAGFNQQPHALRDRLAEELGVSQDTVAVSLGSLVRVNCIVDLKTLTPGHFQLQAFGRELMRAISD